MPVILSQSPGRVIRLQTGLGNFPFAIRFGFNTQRAILTQASVEHQGNMQFLNSINDLIHIYVFGERPGEMQLSGLAFPQMCDGGDGVADVLNYYYNNRAAIRGQPVVVQFGSITYQGFLDATRVDVIRPEALLAQWFLRLKTFLQ